jgi:type II secretory pathway component PulK
VTLLTILIFEFTYSVRVETHISRNALNNLQATYLARSGINVLAGMLQLDEDDKVDPGMEDQWRPFALGNSIELPIPNVPDTWRVWLRIVDEGGKVNVNLTRPSNPAPSQTPTSGQSQAVKECDPKKPATSAYCWRDILATLGSRAGIDADTLKEELDQHWITAITAPKLGQAAQPLAPEFNSLEEVASAFPIMQTRSVFDSLQKYTTALPLQGTTKSRKLNINTVSPTVLQAVLAVTENDEAAVAEIIARRTEEPYSNAGEAFASVENKAGIISWFDVKSNLFRLEASAVVNGVGKTVRALVLREKAPPPKNAPAGTIGWRITFLDWQKESGLKAVREAQMEGGAEGLEAGDNSANNEY